VEDAARYLPRLIGEVAREPAELGLLASSDGRYQIVLFNEGGAKAPGSERNSRRGSWCLVIATARAHDFRTIGDGRHGWRSLSLPKQETGEGRNERPLQDSEAVMRKFIPLAVLISALSLEGGLFGVQPASAGNVPVINIQVHPTLICVDKRC
jgi:hypothetical protein